MACDSSVVTIASSEICTTPLNLVFDFLSSAVEVCAADAMTQTRTEVKANAMSRATDPTAAILRNVVLQNRHQRKAEQHGRQTRTPASQPAADRYGRQKGKKERLILPRPQHQREQQRVARKWLRPSSSQEAAARKQSAG